MSYLTIIFIALGLSMDSMAVSISSGIFMKKFSTGFSMKLALILGFFQGGFTFIGWLLGNSFKDYIGNIEPWVAFILLSYLGGKMIYESTKQERAKPETLGDRTIFSLTIATGIDAFAVGIGFAILQTPILTPMIIITLTTILLSLIGTFCGSKSSRIKEVNMEFFGGLILIAIGLKILLQHTGIL